MLGARLSGEDRYALVQILSRVGLVVFPVIIAQFLTAVLQSMMTVLELDAPARRC